MSEQSVNKYDIEMEDERMISESKNRAKQFMKDKQIHQPPIHSKIPGSAEKKRALYKQSVSANQ